MALLYNAHDESLVAVGTEQAREFGGPDKAIELIERARSVATVRLRAKRVAQGHALDGPLKFDRPPQLGASLNDAETLDALFKSCLRNWSEHTERPLEKVKLLRALMLQATQGDCDEPMPFDPNAREYWQPWADLLGLGKPEAKRRYIHILARLSPHLAVPKLPSTSPPGFPRAVDGQKVCARCNTLRGCDNAPLDEQGEEISKHLSSFSILRDRARMARLLDAAVATPRCLEGAHLPADKSCAKAYESWFTIPGLGGFCAFQQHTGRTDKSTAFLAVAAELNHAVTREHDAHAWLTDWIASIKYPTEASPAESLEYEASKAARDELGLLCLDLRQFYGDWSKKRFRLDAPCAFTDRRLCNLRRELAGGANHAHGQDEASLPGRPNVDLSLTYGALADLKRGASTILAPPLQGPVAPKSSKGFALAALNGADRGVVEHAEVLARRIAVEHGKYATRMEAIRRCVDRKANQPGIVQIIKDRARTAAVQLLISSIDARDVEAATCLIRRKAAGAAGGQTETRGGLTALMACVVLSDRKKATALAATGEIDVDFPSRQTGLSAMALAAKRGDLVMLHHLFDLDASPALPIKYKVLGTPGFKAARLKGGALFGDAAYTSDCVAHFAWTALGAASASGQILAVDVLVERTKRYRGSAAVLRMLDETFTPKGFSSLHFAVLKRDVRMVIHLVRHGATADVADGRGGAPAELGMKLKLFHLVDFLKEASDKGPYVETRKSADLHRRAAMQFAKLDRLLKARAALHRQNMLLRDNGQFANDGPKDSFILILKGGDVGPDAETAHGVTPLLAAAGENDAGAVAQLIKLGADPDYPNRNLRTPLMAAAATDALDAALELLRNGANAKLKDIDGRHASAYALAARVTPGAPLAELLLDARELGNVSALDRHGARSAAAAAMLQLQAPQKGPTALRRPPPADADDDSWLWRLKPRRAVAYVSSSNFEPKGLYASSSLSSASSSSAPTLCLASDVSGGPALQGAPKPTALYALTGAAAAMQASAKVQAREKAVLSADRLAAAAACAAAKAQLEAPPDLRDLKRAYRLRFGDGALRSLVHGEEIL